MTCQLHSAGDAEVGSEPGPPNSRTHVLAAILCCHEEGPIYMGLQTMVHGWAEIQELRAAGHALRLPKSEPDEHSPEGAQPLRCCSPRVWLGSPSAHVRATSQMQEGIWSTCGRRGLHPSTWKVAAEETAHTPMAASL